MTARLMSDECTMSTPFRPERRCVMRGVCRDASRQVCGSAQLRDTHQEQRKLSVIQQISGTKPIFFSLSEHL